MEAVALEKDAALQQVAACGKKLQRLDFVMASDPKEIETLELHCVSKTASLRLLAWQPGDPKWDLVPVETDLMQGQGPWETTVAAG